MGRKQNSTNGRAFAVWPDGCRRLWQIASSATCGKGRLAVARTRSSAASSSPSCLVRYALILHLQGAGACARGGGVAPGERGPDNAQERARKPSAHPNSAGRRRRPAERALAQGCLGVSWVLLAFQGDKGFSNPIWRIFAPSPAPRPALPHRPQPQHRPRGAGGAWGAS